jgi:glycerol uptake facilitator-like aquaporin
MVKKYLSEFIGTFLLTSCVVGSGIMAENLSNGNLALALLANTIATGAILFVIIKMFSQISGAHFNPIVSFTFFLRRELEKNDFVYYVAIQIISALLAIILTHYLFDLSLFQISKNHRGELNMLVSEAIATFGLVLTILLVRENDETSVALSVALYIMAGYWFTPSTSFANPAVLIGRVFTNTFTGIAPSSFLFFLLGQLLGALLSLLIYKSLNRS